MIRKLFKYFVIKSYVVSVDPVCQLSIWWMNSIQIDKEWEKGSVRGCKVYIAVPVLQFGLDANAASLVYRRTAALRERC